MHAYASEDEELQQGAAGRYRIDLQCAHRQRADPPRHLPRASSDTTDLKQPGVIDPLRPQRLEPEPEPNPGPSLARARARSPNRSPLPNLSRDLTGSQYCASRARSRSSP